MNSAHGSCRLRSWATPSMTSGTRCVPGGGLSRTDRTIPDRAAPSAQAGFARNPIKRSRWRRRRFHAKSELPARRHRALTAPAVFDGCSGLRGRGCLQKLACIDGSVDAGLESYLAAIVSDEVSTATPTPIVLDNATFCRNTPLAVDGLALITS